MTEIIEQHQAGQCAECGKPRMIPHKNGEKEHFMSAVTKDDNGKTIIGKFLCPDCYNNPNIKKF